MIHNFTKMLKRSNSEEDELFWDKAHRSAFDVFDIEKCIDLELQKSGVDRIVTLKNGCMLYIDEKLREKDYGDVLLEYISNDTTGAPGWIEKDQKTNVIAYGVRPTKTVMYFTFSWLRHAWEKNKKTFLEKYKIPPAKNIGYNTHSVAIPLCVLMKIIPQEHIFTVRFE